MMKQEQNKLVDTKDEKTDLFVTLKDDTNESLELTINNIDINEGSVGGNSYFFQEITLLKDQTITVYDLDSEDYVDKEIKENKPAVLKFSSKRLKNALQNNAENIENTPIEIQRYGKGFDTHYKIYGTKQR